MTPRVRGEEGRSKCVHVCGGTAMCEAQRMGKKCGVSVGVAGGGFKRFQNTRQGHDVESGGDGFIGSVNWRPWWNILPPQTNIEPEN